jgi:ubiquinone/menaquinone biosynthesis C-methylase UbiE
MPLVESFRTTTFGRRAMSFDRLAPYYRGMEWVLAGGILQRCRTCFLLEAANARRALLLGEGPGRFLAELLRTNRHAEVVCVERSSRMIHEARGALDPSDLARVRFEQADALAWQPPHGVFDLVVTHFFLDCFRREEVQALVARVAASATAEARWLLADFREPDAGWRRWRARALLAVMYGFFRRATDLTAFRLTPPDEFLERGGFRLAARRLANFGLAHSDLWRRDAP